MRNYKRKTNRKPITPDMLRIAQRRQQKGESIRSIAKEFHIDESSLRKRLKRGFGVEALGKFERTFTHDQELALAEHCRQMDVRFYGVTRKSFRQLAYQYAIQNEIPSQFNHETKMAGEQWTQSFLSRHKLTLRVPQKTSVGRIMGFNKKQIDIFYDNLTQMLSKFNFPPSRVYNMDETGITTVPNKVPKIIATKGKKRVNKVSSAERGQLVTAVCCFSAGGHYVPPALIFPRKRLKPELLNGAPAESIMFVSDSGYINAELFCRWFYHFQKHVRGTAEDPVLLVLDNHLSHCTLETVTFCRTNNIHLLSIPPHASHKVQPLDRAFFKSLKDFYSDLCDQWLVNNPGRVITQSEVGKIFGDAYSKTCTIERASNAFRACGIVPLNRFIFSDEDFLPSTVTDQIEESEPEETVIGTVTDISSSDDEIPLSAYKKRMKMTTETNLKEKILANQPHDVTLMPPTYETVCKTSEPVPSTSKSALKTAEPIPSTSKSIIKSLEPIPSTFKSALKTAEPVPSTSKSSIKSLEPIPSTSKTITKTSEPKNVDKENNSLLKLPSDILPYPKIKEKRTRRRKGKKSTILTSTPNKEELENELQKKLEKDRKKQGKKFLTSKKNIQELRNTEEEKSEEEEIFCPGCDKEYQNPQQKIG